MDKLQDPLVHIPVDKWADLQEEFLRDWPRSIVGYWALGFQREWLQHGLKHDFNVYCPYGDVRNGMVALQTKGPSREIIIECARDDTTHLEDALRKTKRIDWSKNYTVPAPPSHITRCLQMVIKDIGMNMKKPGPPHYMFLLPKETPMFEDIRLPEGVTIELLTDEHIGLVDSTWVNRHKGSAWFFKLLVKVQYGFGLFKNRQLACFVFINEVGFLTHLFTLDNFRKQGYAEILIKYVCNDLFKKQKDVFCFVMDGNSNALKLYQKLGFEKYHPVSWGFLSPETSKL